MMTSDKQKPFYPWAHYLTYRKMSLFPNVHTGDILTSTEPGPPPSCPHCSLQLLTEVMSEPLCHVQVHSTKKHQHNTFQTPQAVKIQSSYLELSVSWWTPYGDEQECEVTISSVPTVQQQLSMYCNLL